MFFTPVLVIFCCLSSGYCAVKTTSIESALKQFNNKQDFILVDVRDAAQFEKFHIPDSINIPLFALKTKTFLKPKPIILIDAGHSYKQLKDESEILSKAGFIISILDGGLCQWKQMGGLLEGDVFAQNKLNTISPQLFFAGQSYENWIVIDVSKAAISAPLRANRTGKKGKTVTDNKDIRLEAGRIAIPFASDPKAFVQKLKLAIKNHKEKNFLSVILCDENEKNYGEIENHLQAAGIRNAIYLEGGLEGYGAYEKQMSLVQAKGSVNSIKTENSSKRGCAMCQ
jgi:rhodanese-related sulfurtransferase